MFGQIPGIELTNGIIGKLGGGLPLITKDGISVGSIGGWPLGVLGGGLLDYLLIAMLLFTYIFGCCPTRSFLSSCPGISGAPTAGTDEEVAQLAVDEIDRILDTYW